MKRLSGTTEELAKILHQEQLALHQENENVEKLVAEIIARVQAEGDQALKHYSRQFDQQEIENFWFLFHQNF